MKVGNKQRVALCLGGGGIKAAAFHIGACMALQERGFQFLGGSKEQVEEARKSTDSPYPPITTYIGSSAGAIISAYLACGYSISTITKSFAMDSEMVAKESGVNNGHLHPLTYADIFQLNGSSLLNYLPSNFLKKPAILGGFEALLKSGFKLNGMFRTNGIEKYLREEVLITNDFSKLGVELYVIATQLNHQRKVIFGNVGETRKHEHVKWSGYASISDAVAASTALPPIFAPYPIKNSKGKDIYFFDGEIRDTLSSHVAEDTDADLVLASYSIQPYHYTEEMGSLHKYGIPVIINQALYQVVQQKIYRFIREKQKYREIINDINDFFVENNLPKEHAKKLVDLIAAKFEHKNNVDYIYLHPSPKDYELFFLDHFSLSSKILGKIVKIGFLSATRCLREYGL
tara:strand:- start:36101 stop:37306 length:1206 start_codon:yes stop_codon:yes gene_type:complete